LEAGLIEIWGRTLNVSAITANDDFYDSGGDSFLAIKRLLEVERQFGIKPQPSMLAGGRRMRAPASSGREIHHQSRRRVRSVAMNLIVDRRAIRCQFVT